MTRLLFPRKRIRRPWLFSLYLILLLVGMLVISLLVAFKVLNVESNVVEGLASNLAAGVFGSLVTVFLIDRLLKSKERREWATVEGLFNCRTLRTIDSLFREILPETAFRSEGVVHVFSGTPARSLMLRDDIVAELESVLGDKWSPDRLANITGFLAAMREHFQSFGTYPAGTAGREVIVQTLRLESSLTLVVDILVPVPGESNEEAKASYAAAMRPVARKAIELKKTVERQADETYSVQEWHEKTMREALFVVNESSALLAELDRSDPIRRGGTLWQKLRLVVRLTMRRLLRSLRRELDLIL